MLSAAEKCTSATRSPTNADYESSGLDCEESPCPGSQCLPGRGTRGASGSVLIPLTEYSLEAIVGIEVQIQSKTMTWEVEYTDEFGDWFKDLTESEQDSIDRNVYLLEQFGPTLSDRYSKPVVTSRYTHMRELRVQHGGEPIRVLYAFDPRRVALLLLGGNKTGDDRWYEKSVPRADELYEQHLRELADPDR
jgi:hypothetical protein